MNMKGVNLSSKSRNLVKEKKINFVDFLKWFSSNKEKINKAKYVIEIEKIYQEYFNNPDDYIYVLIHKYKIHKYKSKILN